MQKIAILIPVKNGDPYIDNCIQSIEQQSSFIKKEFDYEIIFVDNNSTDSTKEKIKKYIKTTYIFCETPGIVAALNTGLFHIMNKPEIEYIARLDIDDTWAENKIEVQFKYMLKNPQIDICGTGIRFIRDDFFNEWYYGEKHDQIIGDLKIGHNPIAHSSVIYKKKIFYKCGGYDETFKFNEDLDLWVRASKHFIFHNIQEILLYYKVNNKNEKEQQKNAEKLKNKIKLIHDYL